jgi:hypothetical protein
MVPPDFHRYSFQRILFAIGTNPDVPLIQVAAAGAGAVKDRADTRAIRRNPER